MRLSVIFTPSSTSLTLDAIDGSMRRDFPNPSVYRYYRTNSPITTDNENSRIGLLWRTLRRPRYLTVSAKSQAQLPVADDAGNLNVIDCESDYELNLTISIRQSDTWAERGR